MKKLVVGLILFGLMGVAVANPYGHGHGHQRNNNWVAPALIGGIVGFAIARQQQPVIVSPQYYGYYPTPPVVGYYQPQVIQTYRYETIFDAYCNCYRTIAVPN